MKPLMLYDGTCGFCCFWIERWRKMTGDRILYAPSQQLGYQYPQIRKEDFSKAVQLIRSDGSVAGGAEAVLETLGWRWAYRSIPGLAWLAELAYRIVARHRPLFYKLTQLVLGRGEPARANPCARL